MQKTAADSRSWILDTTDRTVFIAAAESLFASRWPNISLQREREGDCELSLSTGAAWGTLARRNWVTLTRRKEFTSRHSSRRALQSQSPGIYTPRDRYPANSAALIREFPRTLRRLPRERPLERFSLPSFFAPFFLPPSTCSSIVTALRCAECKNLSLVLLFACLLRTLNASVCCWASRRELASLRACD